jgi:hypothetical protein
MPLHRNCSRSLQGKRRSLCTKIRPLIRPLRGKHFFGMSRSGHILLFEYPVYSIVNVSWTPVHRSVTIAIHSYPTVLRGQKTRGSHQPHATVKPFWGTGFLFECGKECGSGSFLVRHEVTVRTTRLVEAHVLQRMKHVWDRSARYPPPRPPPSLSQSLCP